MEEVPQPLKELLEANNVVMKNVWSTERSIEAPKAVPM